MMFVKKREAGGARAACLSFLYSAYAPVYSYNWPPPKPLPVEVDWYWLDETSVQCEVIHEVSALCPPPGPPPFPLMRKKRTVPFLTSAASWLVVRMGSLPEKPPSAMTGWLVARMMPSASCELATATRYFAPLRCASR